MLVGSGASVAAELARIQDLSDVDGFNIAYAITPGTFEDVVDFVVPELQKLGRYKTEYAPGSLRNKLLGNGDRLDDTHRGASYRLGARNSTATTDLSSISAQLVSQGAQ